MFSCLVSSWDQNDSRRSVSVQAIIQDRSIPRKIWRPTLRHDDDANVLDDRSPQLTAIEPDDAAAETLHLPVHGGGTAGASPPPPFHKQMKRTRSMPQANEQREGATPWAPRLRWLSRALVQVWVNSGSFHSLLAVHALSATPAVPAVVDAYPPSVCLLLARAGCDSARAVSGRPVLANRLSIQMAAGQQFVCIAAFFRCSH